MPKLIINEFYGGLAPRHEIGNFQFQRHGGKATYASGVCDPIQDLGILSPPVNQTTDLTGIAALGSGKIIQNWASWENSGAPKFFGIENGVQLQHISSGVTHTLDNPNFGTDIAAHSTHATPIGQDIVMYQKSGSTKVFYAWADNTDGDVGTIDTDGTNQEDDFMSTAGTNDPTGALASTALFDDSAYPIMLEVADNNYLYMFQKNLVHKYDGTTNGGTQGIFSGTVVDLPADWVIKDARDAKGVMWIGAVQSASGAFSEAAERKIGVYVWNRISTQVKFDDYLPMAGASRLHSIFFNDGIPYAFTSSIDATGNGSIIELRRYNGREFEVIKNVGQVNEPHRRGVFQINKMIGWLGEDGGIYAYGKPHGELQQCLLELSSIPLTTSDGQGAVIKSYSQSYYLSYVNPAGTAKLQQWKPSVAAQTTHSGTYKSLVYDLPKFSNVKSVSVFWVGQGVSGSDIDMRVNVYKNMNSTADKTFDINYSTDGTRGWFYQPIGTDNWHTCQIGLNWPSNGTLPYDAQSANFVVAETITGATSGATAVIVSDSDSGTTGTLTLTRISGTFQDNETITSTSGSATVNGTVTYTTTAVNGSIRPFRIEVEYEVTGKLK